MGPKVVFINQNFQDKIKSISQITIGPPLGMAYLAAVLLNNGINTQIIDANALRMSSKEILKNIARTKPDIVGLSAVTPTIYQTHKLAGSIKRILPKVKIMLGGVHASVLPKDTLKRFNSFDVVVINEGEMVISDLVKVLFIGKSLKNLKGIAYRDSKGNIKINKENTFMENLDKIPFPARHLLPMKLYSSVVSDKFTTMIAMRGCYANCNYCSVPFFSGKRIRRRSPSNIIKEMEHCHKEFGIKHFSFLDDTFTTDKRWVHEFCYAISNSKINKRITWMCLTRADNIDEFLLKDMKNSGCIKIEFGIESGSQKILDFSKKGLDKAQIRKAFNLAKKVGIPTLGFIILNMPLEDENTIKETKKFILDIDPDFLQVSFATPYPGTDLETYAKKENLSLEQDWSKYVFLKNITMENKNIPKKRLLKLKSNLEISFYLRPKYFIRLLSFSFKYKAWIPIIKSTFNGMIQLIKNN